MVTKSRYIAHFSIHSNDIANGSITYSDLGTIYTTNVIEGANLYFSNDRVYANVVTLDYATQSFVGNAIANLVSSAPGTLDTLNELALALGNDNAFSTTVINLIANKANASVVDALTTANIPESGNLYFTNARARAAISVAGSGSYDEASGIITVTGGVASVNGANGTVVLTTANIEESGNLYFTNTRARAAITAGNTLVYTEATGNITLSTSGVTAGTYGGATQAAALVVDKFGRITSASNVAISGGSGSPGGSSGQIQYNSSGSFAGSANLFWDDTNSRLGIGTSSPAIRLDVRQAGVAALFTSTNGNANQIGFSNSATAVIGFYMGSSAADVLQFSNSAGTERMRINSAGNVGIGTNSPTARLHISGGSLKHGTSFLSVDASKNIYISTTGNDTTGDGSSGAPYATLGKALGDIPHVVNYDVYIRFMSGTHTINGTNYLTRISGKGRVFFLGEAGASITGTPGLECRDVACPIEFNNINITNTGDGVTFTFYDCDRVYFQSNCTIVNSGKSGAGWSYVLIFDAVKRIDLRATINVTVSGNTGLGAIVVITNSNCYFGGTVNKTTGNKANAGFGIGNNSDLYNNGTVNNCITGVIAGNNHYGDQSSASMTNVGASITNCTTGVYVTAHSTFWNYSTTWTGTTTNIYTNNGFAAGNGNITGNLGVGTELLTYRLMCNGQPAANGYTAWTNYSDQRLKSNIADYAVSGILNQLMQLRPVTFNYNALTGFDEETQNRTIVGFVAQELQQVFPEMVGTTTIQGTEYLDTNLSNLNFVLVRALQEQQTQITSLMARIAALEGN